MYKALNYWVFGGFDGQKTPYEFIDWAAEQGLDGVELTIGECLKDDITKEECEKIAAYAKSKNIGLRSVATGSGWGCGLGTGDEKERTAAVENVKRYLTIASWIGAESVLVVPGATRVAWDPSHAVWSYKTVWDSVTKSVKELIPTAEALKVNLALENVWNRFLISPMEWKLFLDQFDSEYIGMYFDTGNCCLTGRPQDFPELLGNRIKAVHVKNFEEQDAGGVLHGFGDDLSVGIVDFKAVFAEFDKIGYKGPFTAEMIPFSRLPDMVLPDIPLAEKTVKILKSL